ATDTQNDSDAHSIAQMQQRTAQQIQNLQTQLDTANSRLSRAKAKDRAAFAADRDALKGQLQLEQALQENLHKLDAFVTSTENSSGAVNDLSGKVLALQRNVFGNAATKTNKP